MNGTETNLKRCSYCGEVKPMTTKYFHRGGKRVYLSSRCKVCVNSLARNGSPERVILKGQSKEDILKSYPTKTCWSCKVEFERSPANFHSDVSQPDGLHGSCKACTRERNRRWQASNPERVKVHSERRSYPNGRPLPFPTINRMAENRKYIWSVKMRGVCVFCLDSRPEVLQFHHRDPKSKSFAIYKYGSRDLSEIKLEIAKCDLMCANCHTSLHYWARQS